MKLIGQAVEVGSARHVRVEVLVDRPSKKSGDPPTVFVTKYMDGQIGKQSIGMTLEAARTVAILLQRAVEWHRRGGSHSRANDVIKTKSAAPRRANEWAWTSSHSVPCEYARVL